MPDSFDEAFPGGFEECVSELSGREDIDDPEALCGWLQEHGFEAISNADPETVLADLSVEYVSVVDEPAQRSEWLLAKDEDGPDAEALDAYTEWTAPYLVRKLADEVDDAEAERKVWGAVLVPGESDKQDDLVPDHEIERAAHEYLRDYRKVDEDHTLRDGAGVPIESYIVRNGPETFETPDGDEIEYPEGTWIMGVQVGSDEWDRILDGDLNGFSIYGGASPVPAKDLLTAKQQEALLSMTGQTAKEVDATDATTVLDILDEYLSSGADPDDDIRAFAEWLAANAPDDVTEETTILDADDGGDDADDEEDDSDEDDEDEAKSESQSETTDMTDESDDDETDEQDETNDLLKEVRDTVQETQKSVEAHGDRLDALDDRVSDLEKDEDGGDGEGDDGDGGNGEEEDDDGGAGATTEEVEEVAEAAAKSAVEDSLREAFGADEDDDLDEVVRKYEFEEQTTEEEGLNLSLDGITESEA